MKMEIPKLKYSEPSEKGRVFLKEWLEQWNMAKLESDDEDYEPDGTVTEEQIAGLKSLVRPFDAKVAPGQIRLLSSSVVDAERPYYVAILKRWDEDLLLLAPYSPFSVPATTGELLTGRGHFSLDVLQLWNAVTAPPFLLAKSWLVDELSEQEIEEASAVFANIAGTRPGELPDSLADRVGIEIINTKDPRLRYQKEEAALLEPLRRRTDMYEAFAAALEESEVAAPRLLEIDSRVELPKTAGEGEMPPLSKCVFLADSLNHMTDKELIDILSVESGGPVRSIGFEPLRPENPKEKTLRWEFDKPAPNGDEVVMAFDRKTMRLIGVGRVDKDEDGVFAKIDSIIYSQMENAIAEPSDILLVVARFD